MIEVARFGVDDLTRIVPQPAQAVDWPDVQTLRAQGAVYGDQEHCWTFWEDAQVIACFGLIRSHDEHLTAWAVLSHLSVPALLHAARWCRAYIAAQPERRIDCVVHEQFDNGHQWAGLMGFALEGRQVAFFPNGTDAMIYARVRKG